MILIVYNVNCDAMRIALMHHSPLRDIDNATPRNFLGIANILKRKGIEIEIFVLSDRNATSNFSGYKQHEVKGFIYPNNKSVLKLIEFSALVILNKRPLMWLMNKTNRLIEEIDNYNPDVIIIGDFVLSDMLKRYKERKYNKAKIISLMDSQETFYSNLNAIMNSRIPFRRIIRDVLKRNYIGWDHKMFRNMAKLSSAVVTSSNEGKNEILKGFPEFKNKIVAISPYYVSKIKEKPKPRNRIAKILFIGSYTHGPNIEAIENIRSIIAPKLTDKTFVICGKGCPQKKEGNIDYRGTVPDLSKLMNEVDICISPITTGGGRKAKVFEYLAAGKVVLGTPVSFTGYSAKNNVNALIEKGIERFADRIRDLDSNPKLFKTIQKNVFSAIKTESETEVKRAWFKTLNKILNSDFEHGGSSNPAQCHAS